MHAGVCVKHLLLLSDFGQTWNMLIHFCKIPSLIPNLIKIPLAVLNFMYVDRSKDAHGKASRHIFATFHCKCAIKQIFVNGVA